jgi:hypothetical protein
MLTGVCSGFSRHGRELSALPCSREAPVILAPAAVDRIADYGADWITPSRHDREAEAFELLGDIAKNLAPALSNFISTAQPSLPKLACGISDAVAA